MHRKMSQNVGMPGQSTRRLITVVWVWVFVGKGTGTAKITHGLPMQNTSITMAKAEVFDKYRLTMGRKFANIF